SRAEVPNSRDARFQGGPGMGHRFHGGDNRIVPFKGGDRIGARVQAIVHMTINEPGKKRLAPLFDHQCALRKFRATIRSNGGDTRTVKHYRGPVLPTTFAVDQEDVADGDRHEERRALTRKGGQDLLDMTIHFDFAEYSCQLAPLVNDEGAALNAPVRP